MLNNPWIDLPLGPPYLLPCDSLPVRRFNAKAPPDAALRLELIPEPFLGRPEAPVVLLNLNPGFDEREIVFHYEDSRFIELSRKNLLHEALEHPFYLLDPALRSSLGHQWWMRKLKEPIGDVGLAQTARNILCVEFFPYHSRRYRAAREILHSQAYSFHLVREAIDRGALVVLMRGKSQWTSAVPELIAYPRVHRLNSVQNVSISRGNCPTGYAEMVQALRA